MTGKSVPEEGVVTLCGTQGCCPTVDFTEPGKVIIKDDHGGRVELNAGEWNDLKGKFSATGKR